MDQVVGLRLAGRHLEQPDARHHGVSWVEYLRTRIDAAWRPVEFDYGTLMFVPVANHGDTRLTLCARTGCGIHLDGGRVCSTCRRDYTAFKALGGELSQLAWAAQAEPRVHVERVTGCAVPQCPRPHRQRALCLGHYVPFKSWIGPVALGDADAVDRWLKATSPEPLRRKAECITGCGREGELVGLCTIHDTAYRGWAKRTQLGDRPSRELWLDTYYEPPFDHSGTTLAQRTVTPFALLPEPVRWELLYAVQERDRQGRLLSPVHVRSAYQKLRQAGTQTLVGLVGLGLGYNPRHNRGAMYNQWQRHVEEAHRAWSGVDERDPRIVYMRDLRLHRHHVGIGPNAKVDLRSISQDWIVEALQLWWGETSRGFAQVKRMAAVWVVASGVLAERGTALASLGSQDMDAVVDKLFMRWDSSKEQSRGTTSLRELLEFARRRDEFADTWGQIPGRFAIDKARHRPTGSKSPARSGDEPFRFVPQPIIEHLMNCLGLLTRNDQYTGQPDAYRTAEARAMLYMHERCGRRSSETVKLLDNCVSYDDAGDPYLEWTRGKPPYTKGKRVPIHQETHDVIRDWQMIKSEHGVSSKWLFPNIDTNSTVDTHWATDYLNRRLAELIEQVMTSARFERPVEGSDGNLILFDIRTIDPYSFRHAFAQRYADATDENGRPTTPPDVLQDLMGHVSFNTTMAYYEVSAKRRRKALDAVPPRRLNIRGEAVRVDRERDRFTQVAVSGGHCSEPQNVAQHGHGCMVDHACESCPFFLVDPLEREYMDAKRQALKVKLERARAIKAQQHLLDHYAARIKDCTTIIDGVDAYIEGLEPQERAALRTALESMAEVRRLSTAARAIDLRALLGNKGTP